MSEPVFNPVYWKQRMAVATMREQVHHAVYEVSLEEWAKIRDEHRRILADLIMPNDSIFEGGCGWGRLIGLLPKEWRGRLTGVDICPEFIEIAQRMHTHHQFFTEDLRELHGTYRMHDWGICVSIRDMVVKNMGEKEWDKMLRSLRTVAQKILILEYDANDPGEVI